MHRFLLALRVFFRILFNVEVAQRVERALSGPMVVESPPASRPVPPPPQPPPAKKAPARNDALTLLATLQREARLVDFMKEPIAEYSDAQIGAAVRDVHRDCAKVLDRLFALRPIVSAEEGAAIDVPADAERYRLLGNVTGSPPFRGRLVHHGWEAANCELPAWTGSETAARVVAPAEVELKP